MGICKLYVDDIKLYSITDISVDYMQIQTKLEYNNIAFS